MRRCVFLAAPAPHDGPGETAQLAAYTRMCVRHSTLTKGESPLSGPLVFGHDDILDRNIPAHRRIGIEAALAWLEHAEMVVVYIDRGVTQPMREAMDLAATMGKPIEVRRLAHA